MTPDPDIHVDAAGNVTIHAPSAIVVASAPAPGGEDGDE